MTFDTVVQAKNRWTRYDLRAYEHLLLRHHVGPRDQLSADEILALLPELPDWPARRKLGLGLIRASGRIPDWLVTYPGDGWQQRWEASGADRGMDWLDALRPAGASDSKWVRNQNTCALACLLLTRIVLPSYDFLTRYRSNTLTLRACSGPHAP